MDRAALENAYDFLDLASDYLSTGYRAVHEKRNFDALPSPHESTRDKASPEAASGPATLPGFVLVAVETPLSEPGLALLDKMISSIALKRGENAELVTFSPGESLDAILAEKPARFVLAMARETEVSRKRGQFYPLCGAEVLWSFSPASIMQNPGLKRPAWEDLKTLRAHIGD